MTALIRPRRFTGTILVPASKSHTIRQLFIASMADGVSEIEFPLDTLDTQYCVSVCRALGAVIKEHRENGKLKRWIVRGNGNLRAQELTQCYVGNSGTTLFFALAIAALGSEPVEFDGDEQIRRRSAEPLLEALAGLGVSVTSAPEGRAPITVCGPWAGGRVRLSCSTSQYLSALLLAAPLAPAGTVTEIDIPLLNERPFIETTLSYLDSQEIPYKTTRDFSYFQIPGGSAWLPLAGPVPGDFSLAAFPAAAAAISGGYVNLLGLDPEDTQGDKAFFEFLEKMGCKVSCEQIPVERVLLGDHITPGLRVHGVQAAELHLVEWLLKISRSGPLKGGMFDLNDTPDLLPALAAVACFAEGETALINAAHARNKETDRITVMAEELRKLGVRVSERHDGLIVHGSGGIPNNPRSGNFKLDGRGDHRVVMALAAAALGCPAPVEISGAESAVITYPDFFDLLGAEML